ncbi:hypothetical protein DPV78_007505 [Talaromyces pinophilus]|nr:hypothetical protein DPV78_007505 [Talaromyces pinophilus]
MFTIHQVSGMSGPTTPRYDYRYALDMRLDIEVSVNYTSWFSRKEAYLLIKHSPTLSTTYLRDAGAEGWNQALRLNPCYVTINDEAPASIVGNFEKYMPNHQPLCVGVTRIDEDDIGVEIEFVAVFSIKCNIQYFWSTF